ncbi:MAG: hypothetical protein HYZ15_02335 [Sphingobacteriales bacterium]|nr:hypothetical protein [Sphingobacteriales bacterium]
MKKLMLPALALALAFTANAQEIPERKTDHPPMLQHRMQKARHDRMMVMKQLNLTAAQKEQFKTQQEEFRKKMEDLRKNDGITVKEWRTRKENLRTDHRAKMESIYTPEQKAQLEKMKKDRQLRQQDWMKKRGERMKTQLGLTAEQSAKLEKSRKEMSEKIKAVREDKSLTEEKKREAIKQLASNHRESLKSILTEEQLKKMKEGRRQGPGMKHKGPGMHRQGPPPAPPAEKQTL